jgi:hypothetical protein
VRLFLAIFLITSSEVLSLFAFAQEPRKISIEGVVAFLLLDVNYMDS